MEEKKRLATEKIKRRVERKGEWALLYGWVRGEEGRKGGRGEGKGQEKQ